MKKAFLQIRTLSALAMASALVACGGGGGGGTAANTAPVPADVTNVTVLAGSAFSFVLPAFTDAQGNTLTYSLTRADGSALPTGLSLDAASRTVSGTTALALAAPLGLKIKATDTGGLSSEASFVLNAVKPGIYEYASRPTLFHGVVLPGATGVADVWTWEFKEAQGSDRGFSKYFNGNVANLGVAMSTTAADRRVYVAQNNNDALNYSLNSAASVTVSGVLSNASPSLYTDSQSFVVGPVNDKTTYTAALNAEWNNAVTLADLNGVWILKETLPDTSVITTRWTINNGGIVGTKKTGVTTLCTVTGTVTMAAADKAVSRIAATNTCDIPGSSEKDIDVYSGISFAQVRASGSVTDRAVIMGVNASSRFVAKSFCRLGSVNAGRVDNPNCTE